MMDWGFDDDGIDAHLPALGHPGGSCDGHQPVQ
jgi:hypothetical protein